MARGMRTLAWLLLALPWPALATSDPQIDAIVDEVAARYRLPGIAVGIIEDGQVVYTRTAGELVAGEGQPVTPDTLFKIASNSKSMTTATLARLVDAGKLRWDDPVLKHLPGFRMHDPWVTREMQVRDLLIHDSGLRAGAGDLMLWPEPNLFGRDDIIKGLAHLKPIHSFRSRYDYDNLMYIVAGEVAAAAGGLPYEALVRREVFGPLGMSRCQVGSWSRDGVGNVAQPHMRQGTRHVPIRRDDELIQANTMDAAGGIRCSLNDMLAWIRAWLEPGRADAPWLSRAQRDALWSPQMPMPVSKRQREWDNGRFAAYGYGWRIADVDGVFKVSHTGTLSGMYSVVTLLPDKGVGFVMLTNGEGDEARTVLNQVLVKHYTAPRQPHSVAHYATLIAQEEQAPGVVRAPDTSARRAVGPRDVGAWLGIYRDPWFGEVSLCGRDAAVRFSAAKSPLLTGTLMQVGERFLVDWHDETVDAEAWLDRSAPRAGHAATLTMAKVDPDADFSYDYEDLQFTRVRDCD